MYLYTLIFFTFIGLVTKILCLYIFARSPNINHLNLLTAVITLTKLILLKLLCTF